MAKRNDSPTSPLSFEIEEDLYKSLRVLQKQLGGAPISVLVDYAIRNHDFSRVAKRRGVRRQLSVRLPDQLRAELQKHSRTEKVSMALLIREALEALIKAPMTGADLTQVKEANMPPSKKATAKKATKKAAAKKAVKKAASKKTAAKKAVKKVASKKSAAKKAAGKKTARKRK